MLARIAWSRLVEPGDGTAGALLAALGPAPALRLLIEGVSSRAIAERAEAAGADLARRNLDEALDRWRPRLDRRATLGDIERAIAAGLRVIMPGDSCWPEGFADLGAHAPTVLWTRGDPALLRAPGLSVVGARAATGYGSHVTAEIVDGVCAAGIVIVSGAAYGIDAVAHRTALAAEAPTVAVLAGGADRAYPQAHDSLLERIGREGLVCAEMIPGSAPTKWRFRARNRLIAALTPATLVTEAGIRSGSINTAGHAATLGRALGAVPGPVTSAASTGCHLLIREYGAMLVANAREACELLDIGDQLELFGKERLDGVGGAAGAGEQRVPPVHERVLDAIRFAEDVRRTTSPGVRA
ncbi:DNA-processing protein DprA [Leucobacter soli]|uniref:DNA-processing protein DprA n=1 Tax=Leucobacter soli TaxID=2812850 RepID=UPI00360C847D